MDKREQFFEAVQKEMTMLLATTDGESLTMRTVSPVLYNEKILIFTSAQTEKYRQLKQNPFCCAQVGGFFAQATAELRGETMLEENSELRRVYAAKFHDAFDENVEFGGRSSHFVILTPKRLTGWAFEDGSMQGEGIPTVPINISL